MIKDRIIDFRRVKASEILRNPKNWRTHPESQKDAMKGVLAEIGIADALIARETEDGLMLIDGHLRTDLDDDTEWPVLILDVNEQEADTILATLDPLAAMAGVSKKFLAELITDLEVSDNNLQTMLNNLGKDLDLFPSPEIVEDDVPPIPKNPITKSGDLWILGNHRLLCGDSTKSGDVERLMGGETVSCIFTDPPYNHAGKDSGFAASVSKAHEDLMRADWDVGFKWSSVIPSVESLIENTSIYVCASWHTAPDVWEWMSKHSSHYSYCVWQKPNPMPSLAKRHWTWSSELLCYATYGKHKFNFPSEGHASNVWTIIKKSDGTHPTQKPVAVPTKAITHSSDRGDLVADLFLGSGTTLIAAEQLNRQCYGIEISPQYCDVIIERWEKFSGGKAIRQGSNGAPRKRKVRKKAKKKTAKVKP